jgi:2-oxoglutarate dehydrogenase E1 component
MRKPSSPLSAVSAHYVQELEERYRKDPASIDPGWRCVLDVLQELELDGVPQSTAAMEALIATVYRQQGHLAANLDPLGLNPRLTIAEIEAPIQPIISSATPAFIERLRSIYCGSLAVESAHIDDAALRAWIYAAMEEEIPARDPDADRRVLERLVAAEEFERFMAVKFSAKKRFGAEGAESLIPMLDRLLQNAAMSGVTDIVIGTMHRGRLNVAANVLGKPLETLFAEFKGMHPFAADSAAAADVPYHFGYEALVAFGARTLRVTVSPNPSHLETVNTVALGRARARQSAGGGPQRVLGVLLHTDASVIAQGVVSEMVQLSQLDGFTTGGTIHIIVNNQIGFTTERHEARTSVHCTGSWKAIDSLILHANGDDPQAAVRAADLAFNFRQEHGRDAVIDLVCYRRNGHNEVDEPRFTQPLLYREIDRHPSVLALFGARLIAAGALSAADIDALAMQERARLAQAFEKIGEVRANDLPESVAGDEPATGISLDKVQDLLAAVATVPGGVSVNQKIERIVSQRAHSARTGVPWAVGEALAVASLLTEGTSVRLSGQDSLRGAFSQRHLALIDTQTGQRHVALDRLCVAPARFEAINSPLSEYAVLGFEYGYSVERPEALVIWEAQFGDFANGAQIMIDQFVASAEEKWRQSSGLVLLLPHGLEGQGPEHSSGRLERFLQLCAQDNLDVAQPTTPSNYYHLLRRQVHRQARKPLVIMSAKSLLRLPVAVSPLEEFGPGTAFQSVISTAFGKTVRHVLLCSGKVAYDLEREREARNITDVAIVRLEMLYPFPIGPLTKTLTQWSGARFTWVQEEPRNLGAWNFVDRRLEALLDQIGARHPRVACVSRPESASPAGSFHLYHERDQRRIIDRAFAQISADAAIPCPA